MIMFGFVSKSYTRQVKFEVRLEAESGGSGGNEAYDCRVKRFTNRESWFLIPGSLFHQKEGSHSNLYARALEH